MYADLIKNNQSSGYDLQGFCIDVEAFLEDGEMLSDIKVEITDDVNALLLATCNYNKNFSQSEIINEIEKIWLESLRYQEFEIHSHEILDGKINFYFCTKSGPLGVTGKITAVQNK